MRHLHRFLAIGLISLVVVGCTTPAASLSPSQTAAPTQTAAPSASDQPATTDSPEPVPSDELEEFTCDEFPIHEDATTGRANIVDVRMATHDGYDRVVFEFVDGLPEAFLERVDPPFTQDASGLPIDVEGTSFLRLIMRGGTKQTDEGTSSYDGPTEFDPGFPTLVDLVEGGDFEAQSTWYFGLSSEACVRVLALTDDGAPRLVIDVEN
jgi:hypothetical protein